MFFKKKNKSMSISDLEKNLDKSKLDVQKKKKDKSLSPVMLSTLKFIRIFLWSCIILLIIIGIFSVVRSKRPKIIENVIRYDFAESESETAKAFAVAFAKEYLTYNSSNRKDYTERVSPFFVNALSAVNTKIEQSKGDSKAIDAFVWSVEKLNENHSNIIVRAEVEVIKSKEEKNEVGEIVAIEDKSRSIKYISIPVGVQSGKYIVEDFPNFVPDPEPAELDFETLDGEIVMDDVKEEVKKVLTNFLKTYSMGNEGQISYYMSDNKAIKGFEGKYLFEDIKTIDVFTEENEVVSAVVQASMKDSEMETTFTQRYVFQLEKKSDRWYITEFKNRGNIFVGGEEYESFE